VVNLFRLDGNDGFRLDGANAYERSGSSLASTDFNGDHLADLIIGAPHASPDRKDIAGSSYAVFGRRSGFPASFSLSALDGINGFRIDGANRGDGSGISVAGAGDVNGDGFADAIFGAAWADPGGRGQAGSSYVVFGKASRYLAAFKLASLNGSNGFRLDGVSAEDWSGFRVANAGDVNADGFADLIIGAPNASPGGLKAAGSSYLVFGNRDSPGGMNLAMLDPQSGVRIDGAVADEATGGATASAGDFDHDGYPDVIVGGKSGSSYVLLTGTIPIAVQRSVPRGAEKPSSFSVTPRTALIDETASRVVFSVSRSQIGQAETVFVSTTTNRGYTNQKDFEEIDHRPLSFQVGERLKAVSARITHSDSPSSRTFGFVVQRNRTDPIAIMLAEATFTILGESRPTLSVQVTGSGKVTSSPAGIECPTLCRSEFRRAQRVSLVAMPAPDWEFAGWSGICAGTADTCSVVLARAAHVSAQFRTKSAPASLQFGSSPSNLNIRALLANGQALAGAQARGIVADGTSEAIVIYEAAESSSVLIAASGGVLTSYSDGFLSSNLNSAAGDTLEISPEKFVEVAGKRYAIALVRPQAVQASALRIEASQPSGRQHVVSVSVLRPPIILVHGLWEDVTALEPIHTFLARTQEPPNDYIFPFYYPRYLAFDDDRVWSGLFTEIDSAVNQLDNDHVVGGRVDVIGYGMGGLVIRHLFASQNYRSWHDRKRGRFHLIITVDTPQNGSLLASYLVQHALDRNTASDQGGRQFWSMMCQRSSPLTTLEQCFREGGFPFGSNASAGAIFSLAANSASMERLKPVPTSVGDTKWLAILGQASTKNSLTTFFDGFLAEAGRTDTVNSILSHKVNDVFATIQSQSAGVNRERSSTVKGLTHIDMPWSSSRRHILSSPEINNLIACWLDTSGSSSCQTANTRNFAPESPERSVTPKASQKRLLLNPPRYGRVGESIDVSIRPRSVRSLTFEQRDEFGNTLGPTPVNVEHNAAGWSARATPLLLGNVRYRFRAILRDGTVLTEQTNVVIEAPAPSPTEFRADAHFKQIVLGHIGAAYRLHPAARYSDAKALSPRTSALYPSEPKLYPGGGVAIQLDNRVQYRLLPSEGEPVVHLASDGTITALTPGTARIKASFGSTFDVITVRVRAGL
jgi:hypothetical protein